MHFLKMDQSWLDANAGLMAGLMMIGVGIFSIAVLFMIAPAVGSKIETAAPAAVGSNWNHTVNGDIPTGYEMWQSNAAMLSVAVLVVIAGVILAALSISM